MGANKQPVIGSGVLPYVTPVEDTTAPTVTAANIAANGITLTVNYSEATSGHSGFGIDGYTVTYVSGDGTMVNTFSLSPAVLDTDAPALDYTPGNVQDASENALEAFTNAVIDNGSTQTDIPPSEFDADTLAFATAYNAEAGADLTGAELALIDSIVSTKKDGGNWTDTAFTLPLIGGTATRHAIKLKTGTITWQEGFSHTVVHDANGVIASSTGNNCGGNTGVNASTLDPTDISISMYVQALATFDGNDDMGVLDTGTFVGNLLVRAGSGGGTRPSVTLCNVTATGTTTEPQVGMWTFNSRAGVVQIWHNGVLYYETTATPSGSFISGNIGVMGRLQTNSSNWIDATGRRFSYFEVAKGMTAAEIEALHVAVEGFESGFGRSAYGVTADEQNFIDGIDDHLDGTDDPAVFSGASRNGSLWLSPAPTWVPIGGRNGVPITRRHMQFAYHQPGYDGMEVEFKTADGTPVTRTISGAPVLAFGDICVAKLDSNLPETITIPKIGPANLATLCRVNLLPMVSVHRGVNAYIGMCSWNYPTRLAFLRPSDATRAALFANAYGQVSGSWCGLISAATGEPVTLGCMHLGTGSSDDVMGGLDYSGSYISEINAAINAVGNPDGYTVTEWTP